MGFAQTCKLGADNWLENAVGTRRCKYASCACLASLFWMTAKRGASLPLLRVHAAALLLATPAGHVHNSCKELISNWTTH